MSSSLTSETWQRRAWHRPVALGKSSYGEGRRGRSALRPQVKMTLGKKEGGKEGRRRGVHTAAAVAAGTTSFLRHGPIHARWRLSERKFSMAQNGWWLASTNPTLKVKVMLENPTPQSSSGREAMYFLSEINLLGSFSLEVSTRRRRRRRPFQISHEADAY